MHEALRHIRFHIAQMAAAVHDVGRAGPDWRDLAGIRMGENYRRIVRRTLTADLAWRMARVSAAHDRWFNEMAAAADRAHPFGFPLRSRFVFVFSSTRIRRYRRIIERMTEDQRDGPQPLMFRGIPVIEGPDQRRPWRLVDLQPAGRPG